MMADVGQAKPINSHILLREPANTGEFLDPLRNCCEKGKTSSRIFLRDRVNINHKQKRSN